MSKRVNRDDVDKYHDYGLYLPTRTIYIGSETYDINDGESGVDGKMAERAIKNLHLLDTAAEAPITIILNNPGGDAYHGMAIYDAIQNCCSHVTIQVFGMAMSMGSIILQAADTRLIAPNARVMIHYGEAGVYAHPKILASWAAESKKSDAEMEQIYLAKIRQRYPHFTLKKVQELCNFDTILNAEEAVALGLADGVIGKAAE